MVSSFRGLNEIIQMQKGSGLAFDLKQSTGNLLVGGDSCVIKVWYVQTETQNLVRIAARIIKSCFFYSTILFYFDRISKRIPKVR